MATTRLIVDPPRHGSWNMAVDQALLQSANERGQATMRWYRWSSATLSLGYFQNHSHRCQHAASINCDMVRRASGGGAIMHDQEWTYSVALPSKNRLSRSHETLVRDVHSAMIEVLKRYGFEGELYSSTSSNDEPPTVPSPFLCFQRRAENDLIVGQHKVCGSAQRRIEGAILQHGSLLLRRSSFAPELAGVLDLSQDFETQTREEHIGPDGFDLDDHSPFFIDLKTQVSNCLSLELVEGTLSESELELARAIEIQRFGNSYWTARR